MLLGYSAMVSGHSVREFHLSINFMCSYISNILNIFMEMSINTYCCS